RPPHRGGVPQPLLPPGRRAEDHRPPQAEARHRSGRDHRGRPRDLPHGRVPLRLRGRADGAGGRPLRAEPDAGEDRPPARGAALMAEIVLMRNFPNAESHTLGAYRAGGGYAAWDKARTMEPAAITE